MRITLLANGSRGDVQPYAALALGLKARGHAVRLAAPENFKAYTEELGLDYAPLAGDTRQLMESEAATNAIWKGKNLAFFNAVTRDFAPLKERYYDDTLAACQGSDMVMSSPVTEFIAQSAAEAVGARCALSVLAPQIPTSQYAAQITGIRSFGLGPVNRLSHAIFEAAWWSFSKRDMAALRRRWKLSPLGGSPSPGFRKGGGLVLSAYSPQLVPRPGDWPENLEVTGAWRLPASASSAAAGDHQDSGFVQWLEDGPPPVYFGFGSMPVPDHEGFLEMAAEICEELGLRALIGSGWNDLTMQACDLPDNLAIVESADHRWLFPQCAAIVHHGGAGTTHAALAAGVPTVVASFFADQPFWGGRIEAAGVGRHLRFQRITPARMKKALIGALSEPVAAKAAEVGARVDAEDGVSAACEALERWASKR